MQLLPGFRDFYPEDCARRNYILTKWREVARRYGFVEYDGPVLEPMALYEKKSGGELVGQLFDFVDKGERHVALRPEMTPTLARMVAARERDFKKPLKWFCVPQFFRYEKQQRGRLREFYQLNCDIIGDANVGADGEMISMVVDLMRSFGFTKDDFVVRVSSREIWTEDFLANKFGVLGAVERESDFFAIIDKLEREPESTVNEKLLKLGTSLTEVRHFISRAAQWITTHDESDLTEHIEIGRLQTLFRNEIAPRGLSNFVEPDLTIVRGLAYYTGLVFEVFDRGRKERAIAGGGRYDTLLGLMSDHKVNLPALGFGMGDVVLANLIGDIPAAAAQRDAWLKRERACDVYVIITKAERRRDALRLVQRLREAGQRVDFPLTAVSVSKQFQTAEQVGATRAVLVGDEWPQLKIKTLATREEITVGLEELASALKTII